MNRTNLTRRDFIRTSALGACAATTTLLPTALAAASPLIIDTHTHFYDPTRKEGVPWPDKKDKLLYRKVVPADFRALPKPAPVSGTVVVEASPWVEDNQWILDLAKEDPFIVGFVGHLDPGTPEFRKHLRRFVTNPLFRGIRIGEGSLARGLGEKAFQEDLKALAGADLSLDLLGGPSMLPHVEELVEAAPGLRMVIDHVANLKIDGKEPPKNWQEGMKKCGALPNVYCKVSGLVEGSGRADGSAPQNVDFYRPVLDAIWNSFGSKKLIYGSNWPVSELFAPCNTVQKIVAEYFSERGSDAMEKVFSSNAAAAYKWLKRG